MHIRGNSDTSSGGIDHRQSPISRCMPMTSIIKPHGCWPMYSRQAPLISTPNQPQLRLTPSSSSYFTFTFFPSFLSPLVHPLYMQSSALSSPTTASSFHPPLFPNISVPSSFPPVIRSRWPPAGVNGGENQPEVSGCISSLRCSLAVMRTGTVKAPFPAARDTHKGIMSCMSGKRKKKHLNFCFVPPPVMYSVCGYCAWCLQPPSRIPPSHND